MATFGMFGNPWGRRPSGIGDGLPSGQDAQHEDVFRQGAPKPSFFGEGGTGRQIVGIVGDALSAAGGGQPVYAQAMQQRRQEDFQRERLAREEARLNRPQVVNLGNGGVATWSPDSGLETIREPQANEGVDPAAVKILRAAGVEEGSPEWKRLLIMSMAGYDNSPEALAARVKTAGEVAAAQAAARAQYRAPSGGSGGSGRPLTANQAARYRAEAAAAIARGADPAKVNARLRELGVK